MRKGSCVEFYRDDNKVVFAFADGGKLVLGVSSIGEHPIFSNTGEHPFWFSIPNDCSEEILKQIVPNQVFVEGIQDVLSGKLSIEVLPCFGILSSLFEQTGSMKLINIGLTLQTSKELFTKNERRVKELLEAAKKAHNVGNIPEYDRLISEVEDITCAESH
jgi:hypothetical protein